MRNFAAVMYSKPQFICIFLIGLLIWGGCASQKPTSKKPLKKASDYKSINLQVQVQTVFQQGEELMKSGNYLEGAARFDQVVEMQWNNLSTASLYLAGLCYYYGEENATALQRFQRLLVEYPQCKYVDDINYHKGLMLLYRHPINREGGLFLLMNLIEKSQDADSKKDALNAVNHFLYKETDVAFLQKYYNMVRTTYSDTILKAICYRMYEERQFDKLQRFVEEYGRLKHTMPKQIENMRIRYETVDKPETVRVAVCLPFFNATEEDVNSVAAEYLEGVRLAAEEIEYPFVKHLDLKVIDVGKDSVWAKQLITSELIPFNPDIIIGSFQLPVSKQIGDMVRLRNVIHWIPTATNSDLIVNKKISFLANPSLKTQGRRLAQYVSENLRMKKVAVFSHDAGPSAELAGAFMANVKDTNLKITKIRMPGANQLSDSFWAGARQLLMVEKFEGIYLPLGDEETVLKAFNELGFIDFQAFGTQEWRRFSKVTPEQLSKHKTVFPYSYHTGNDSVSYMAFTNKYYQHYQKLPSSYSAHGYDAMNLLLQSYCLYAPTPLMSDILQNAPVYKGLNQRYYFGGVFDNQSVQLLKSTKDGFIKIQNWE